MKKNDPITKIMSSEVATIQLGQPLSDVRKLMCNSHIHHVPVVEGKKLVGLISFTDLMKINLLISGADERSVDAILDQQCTIRDIMTTNLTTINNTDTVRQAADLLSHGGFHSLPVIDKEGEVIGIVTSTDLINYLYQQY
jgi:CBS domain-containing membrane protein